MSSSIPIHAQTALLLKKLLGKPSTLADTPFFQEPDRNARAAVFQDQIYAEEIPKSAPVDLMSAALDDRGSLIEGSPAGRKSANSPVKRYVKVPLVHVVGSNGASYEAPDDATYGRVLQDSVPFNYGDGSYLIYLYRGDHSVIPFGEGNWILDTDSGVLTFYTSITGVSETNPPLISFYRYVGAKGASTGGSIDAADVVAIVQDTAITFSKTVTFDALDTAIILDSRDLSVLSAETPCWTLNLGNPDSAGSWRLCIMGGGGTSKTHFTLQSLSEQNEWVTKTSFSNNSDSEQ